MKRLFLSLLVLCLAFGQAVAEHKIYQMADYGIMPNQKESIAPKLAKLLALIKEEQARKKTKVKLVFLKGTYYFDSVDSPKKQVYISNHDQIGLRPIGMLIEGMENLTIEGMGSDFICRGRMLPIAVLNSRNIKFNQLSIDFENPQISQIEIVENTDKGITFRPATWVKWRINEQGYFESYGEDWQLVPSTGIAFDKDTKQMLYRVADLGYSTKGAKVLEDGTIYAPQWKDARLKPSSIIAMRTYERPNPAIFLAGNKNIKLNQVKVHYAEGMGLLAQATKDIKLNGFSVCLKDGSKRYFTTQADATHFSACSGKIKVENALFEGMMDDAINVHGVYLKLVKRLDNHRLVGRYMHPQAWGFEWGKKGEKVQFIASKTFDPIAKLNTIKEIEPYEQESLDGAKEFVITFKHKLPKELNENTAIGIENLSRTPSVSFKHNLIRHNRARGTLFNTPKRVLVENNVFDHVSGSAILVSTDCNMWFESGQTKNLIIRNNQFIDVLTSLYQFTEAVISIYPLIPELKKQQQPFYGKERDGILIEDNVFMTFDTPLLFARSTKGILWRKNKLIPTKSFAKYHHNQKKFKFEACQQINIKE